MRFPLAATALLLVSGGAEAADCTRPTPIAVAPGARSASLDSGSPAETADCYQLTGTAGQEINISVENAENDAVLALYAPGWQASCSPAGDCEVTGDLLSDDNEPGWWDTLPATGTYLVVIDNSRSGTPYRLTVELR